MLQSIYATSVSRRPKSAEGEHVFHRLEAIRTGLGHTRQEFADAVGVHYQTIGYLERGEYSPSLALALRIARFLGQPVESLFSLESFDDHLNDDDLDQYDPRHHSDDRSPR